MASDTNKLKLTLTSGLTLESAGFIVWLVLMILKVTDNLTIDWFWVWFPLWAPIAVDLLILFLLVAIVFISVWIEDKNE